MLKRLLFTVLLLPLSGLLGSGFSRIPYPKVGVDLNRTITNESSDIPALEGLDRMVENYLVRWELNGACLAVVRGDSLVYAKGYGYADKERGVRMQPYNLLRIASVSKLVTAVGIMNLVDRGMLSLSDKVFGDEGILYGDVYDGAENDPTYARITVENLLRHQSGITFDPMFEPTTMRSFVGSDREIESDDYIRCALTRKVRYTPGSFTKYSNFGYLLLSRIIESVTEEPYEDFIDRNILEPIGVNDMHIAGNLYLDRYPEEAKYYSHDPSRDPYGDNDITVLSGAGAWCCSVVELAKLVASIDGRGEVEDVLSPDAVEAMTAYNGEAVYSLGWNDTNPEIGWTRTGTFTGTTALVKYFPDGECWIFVANTSTWKGPRLASYTAELFRQCRERYSAKLPRRNLFYY